MANAPTRPPKTSRYGRRPPRGPRLVPISRDDQQRVARIRQASAHLSKTGAPDLAAEVDFLLTEDGRKFVGRLHWQERSDEAPNFGIWMPESLRDEIKAKASTAGAHLQSEAEHALTEFVEGRFTPAQPKRAGRGQAGKKVNLNVRINAALRGRADEMGQELLNEGELDWAPSTSQILVSYFMDRVEEGFRDPIRKQQ